MTSRQRTIAVFAAALVVVGVTAVVFHRDARANVADCHTSALQGGFRDFPNGAAGNDRFDVQLTNIDDRSCALAGYPTLRFQRADHQLYDIPVERGSGMLTPDPGPSRIVLHAGQTASASVAYTPNCNIGQELPQPVAIEITPPEEPDFVLAAVTMPGHLTICGSHVTVTAFVSGASGVRAPGDG